MDEKNYHTVKLNKTETKIFKRLCQSPQHQVWQRYQQVDSESIIEQGRFLAQQINTNKVAECDILAPIFERARFIFELCSHSHESELEIFGTYPVEHGEVLVAYKPGGFSVLEAKKIINIIHPGWSYVHRLDLVTSGCLIGSCETKVRRQLSIAIEHRRCKKLYLALVYGNVKESWFGVHYPINHNKYLTHAYTQFQKIWSNEEYSLLFCYPVTGRNQQIRRHLKVFGHPIIGDKFIKQKQTIFLHAFYYEFPFFQTTSPFVSWLGNFTLTLNLDLDHLKSKFFKLMYELSPD